MGRRALAVHTRARAPRPTPQTHTLLVVPPLLQVRELAAYLAQRAQRGAPTLAYEAAEVVRVEQAGAAGDRACVDTACLLRPGEGLLVGSFARALFLVSE